MVQVQDVLRTADLARASVFGSAAPPALRAELLAGIDAWLAP